MNGAKSSSNIKAALSYCVQEVRNYDYHHYLCLLHLPPHLRPAAFALRAFNVETAKIMDTTSDPKIGLMRLLWWQEAIDRIFAGKLIEHPVAQALSYVSKECRMMKSWLKRSVEARIADARREEDDIPETIQDLEKYAEDTMSTLLYSTLEAGSVRSTIADHAASHIGKATGLLLIIKSLPHHASSSSQSVSYIPADLASKHGLLTKVGGRRHVEIRPSKEVCETVYEMASIASLHLGKARELAGNVPKEAIPVLLPAIPADVLLNSLRKRHYDVFDSRLHKGILGVSPIWFQLKLNWHAFTGNF